MKNINPNFEEKLIKVFISYSRRDETQAIEIYKALKKDNRLTVYLDSNDIIAGEDWRMRLSGLIQTADCVLFLTSPNSIISEICKWEVEFSSSLVSDSKLSI